MAAKQPRSRKRKHQLELSVEQVRHVCDLSLLDFKSTADLPPLDDIIGQERAVRAVSFGIDIESPGYHLYALGPSGTGKTTIIRQFLSRKAAQQPVPDDWCYINNFQDSDRPHALRLPAGKGRVLKSEMEQLIKDLQVEVPRVFESEGYQQRQAQVQKEIEDKRDALLTALAKKAEALGFALAPSPQGFAFIPVRDGKPMTQEAFEQLDEAARQQYTQNLEALQDELPETMLHVRRLQKEARELLEKLDREVVSYAVGHLFDELTQMFKDLDGVVRFLNEVRADIINNVQRLKALDQQPADAAALAQMPGAQQPAYAQYHVNLIVDQSETHGAPVVLEGNPHYNNLLGRIDHEVQFGALVTNFTMIKAGALHRANGGYLIIEARDILAKPFAWDVLKRALKTREIKIEAMGQEMQSVTTRTLEPEPIPLDVKVILIGSAPLYYLLFHGDDDFEELFKVKADFAGQTDWNTTAVEHYAQFIGMICRDENLTHFAPSGAARVVEQAARMVSHQGKLAAKFGDVVDLVRQSSYWAKQAGHTLVTADDVQRAIAESRYRSNQLAERLQELIGERTILIDTSGAVVGQVNGLAVMSMGGYSFGSPSRITARTFVGSAGVVNIERETAMGGPIHNKAVLIMTGYLGGKYAGDMPLALSASITFEQLYDEVEGDSAACAELYALLSSLSGYPIRQDLAVTGSVNQRGEVQAIGGVNEKVEGFFDVCKRQKLTGAQGVLIPASNVKHLMLREDVVEAVRAGKFHIYAVSTVDEGIALLTGKDAGTLGADGMFPEGSVNRAVQDGLRALAEKVRGFAHGSTDSK